MNLVAKITRILVPTDFSPAAEVACLLAARLANHLKAGIVLFHAIPGADFLREMGRARGKTHVEVLYDALARLQRWFETVVPAEFRAFVSVDVNVEVGEPVPGMAWVAQQRRADLIVMATHGRTGLVHLLMGSVTEAVLQSIPVPVLALRHGQGDRPLMAVQRILWATDLSPVSEGAWRYALTLADALAAEVGLLHVVRPTGLGGANHAREDTLVPLRRELERRQQAVEALGLRGRRKVLVGVPAEVIVAEAQAERADLIVVGTHGRSGLPHVLVGSVAEAVIRKAPCPVLAVKAEREGEASEWETDEAAA
ncbi:MAG: universal stress protein [Candidatus Methylomirabilales bacterium]